MSEPPTTSREEIATAQANLVASLCDDRTRPMAGFDPKRLELTAALLARKRARFNTRHRRELRAMLAFAWRRLRAVLRRLHAG